MRGGLAAALALMLAAGAALPVRAAQTEELSPAVSEGSSAPAQAEQLSGGPAELIEDETEEPNEGPDEELSEDPAGELDENSAGNSAGGSTEGPAGETAEGPAADPAEAPAKGSAGEAEEGSPENSAEEPDKNAGKDPAEKPCGPPLLAAAARRGMIVSIEDTETLRVLPPVTVWADELEPLYRRMVELTRVRARAVSAEGGEQTLELAVDWDYTALRFDGPGTYAVSAPILAPEGYAFADGALRTLTIPVILAAERETWAAASFDDLSGRFACAIARGSSWADFFAREFDSESWRNAWPCRAADGTELSPAHIVWADPAPDTAQTGVVTVRGTAVLPEGVVLAEGMALPEVEAPVSVQDPDRPELNCWYLDFGCINFPWVGGGAKDEGRVLLSRDGGPWTDGGSEAYCDGAGVHVAVRPLETGASYRLRAEWDGGGTGVFSFQWTGQVSGAGYQGGDRDGGDTDGNPASSITQPAPGGASHQDGGEPLLEEVTETSSLLSGLRVRMMRESGPVRFSKQGVTVTLSDAALDALALADDSRFFIELRRTEEGFSLAAVLDGAALTALPDTAVLLPCGTAGALTLLDAAGEAVCQGTGDGQTASFTVHETGRYAVAVPAAVPADPAEPEENASASSEADQPEPDAPAAKDPAQPSAEPDGEPEDTPGTQPDAPAPGETVSVPAPGGEIGQPPARERGWLGIAVPAALTLAVLAALGGCAAVWRRTRR